MQNGFDGKRLMEDILRTQKNGTVDELYFYIAEITPKFLKHCCIKRRQAKSYEDDKQIANMPRIYYDDVTNGFC